MCLASSQVLVYLLSFDRHILEVAKQANEGEEVR